MAEPDNKEPLLAKIKRKTVIAGHATRFGAYKTKKNAQIQAVKFKIVERKKKFGVDYMDLVEENASQNEIRACMEEAMKDLAELRSQIEKHSSKIDQREEDFQDMINTPPDEQPPKDSPPEGPRKTSPKAKPASSSHAPGKTQQGKKANDAKAPAAGAKFPKPTTPSTKTPKQGPSSPSKPAARPVRGHPKSPGKPISPPKNAVNSNLRGTKTSIDASRWKLTETTFSGAASYVSLGKQEVVKGKSIKAAIELVKKNPDLYTVIYYQTNMVDWQPDQQQYTLIHREGTEGYTPKGTGKNGWMTLLMQTYERLPPLKDNVLPKQHRDAYTDSMVYNRRKLHSKANKPILPGRGMGVADCPELKIIGDVDPSDIHQGSVGDCWLLSGISALAEFDGAVKRLFRKTKDLDKMPRDNGPNFYTITLWDLTTWTEVDIKIDERLCADPNGQLLASKPSEDGELWVCYIEKAVAAHCGGWDKLVGGQCTHAWALLTGCKEQYMISKNPDTGKYVCHSKYNPYEKRWAKHGNSPHDGERGMWPVPWPKVGGGGDKELTEDELFLRLVAWDKVNYIVGAGTKGESDKNMTDGLVDNHAYSVIESHDNVAGTGIGLLKVRNPWGKGEIEDGEFDDDGPGWDRYPQIKRALKPVVADDGIFWVTKKEFFHFYQTIYLSASDMTEFLED